MAVTNINLSPVGSSQFQDTANSNASIVVKASAGTLFAVDIDNSGLASVVYTKLVDSAGAVVVGTTDPNWIIRVPASVRITVQFVAGHAFAAGLQVFTVTAAGTGGVTAPGTPPTVRIVYS